MAVCTEVSWRPRAWALIFALLLLVFEGPPLAKEIAGNAASGALQGWANGLKIAILGIKFLVCLALTGVPALRDFGFLEDPVWCLVLAIF